MTRFLQIDWVFDLVCPWSFIGYQKLTQTLSELDADIQVEFHWHPFEINPHLSAGGHLLIGHLMDKYHISALAAQTYLERATSHSQALPIPFTLTSTTQIYNTRQAHKLLLWAAKYQQQSSLALELYRAYFIDQRALDTPETLLTAATAVGLNQAEAVAVLADDNWGKTVSNIETQWAKTGIAAVPTLIINRSEIISGEFNSDTLREILHHAATQNIRKTKH
ncbi:MAG: DsbA family oxidoreductase [Vibrio sp.]